MLFQTPELDAVESQVVSEIDGLRASTRAYLAEPKRWTGSLRRVQFARGVQGSNSIEGYNAQLDDAVAIELGEVPLDANEETALAIKGYRDAMTYVLQLADEPRFHFGEQLLKSLHFMMTSYSLKNRPGRWRAGAIYVYNEETEQTVYEGPDFELVDDLVHELMYGLESETESNVLVRAAMAHLNLVMIHPFRDGNGRMARCLQTLVLARGGILEPVFSSVEEYLGRNTQSYYDVLTYVGGGAWHPDNDARPWVRYMLTAHLRQARTVLRRIKESDRIWTELDRIVRRNSLPERMMTALYDATMLFRVRNGVYRALLEQAEEPISDQVASRDLRHLVDLGLLEARGERRGRYYVAGATLREFRRGMIADRDPRDESDPFAAAG
jgi:Fic family protein